MLKKIIFVFYLMVMSLFFLSQDTYGAINQDFTPRWKVGDSWDTVRREMSYALYSTGGGESPGDPIVIHFEVIDLKEIDGEKCYTVEITYKDPTCEYERESVIQLYVRENDFTLKKILKITKSLDGTTHIDDFHDNGHDFVIFRRPFSISIPCDFPNFPVTNTDEERTIQVPGSARLMTQKVTFIDEDTMKIELSTENNNGLLKTTQIWEKGKPWWSSVKRTFTYKDITKPGHPEVTRVEYDNILEGTDLIPPDLTAGVSPTILWPPDHKMVEITPIITVTDDYDRYPEVKVYSVESNEPDDLPGKGDGHTTQDIKITEDGKIFLRAERDAKGDGRIYTITYSATDFSGNISTASAIVTVPHDEEKKK